MSESACDKTQVTVTNAGVYDAQGNQASMTIFSAGPTGNNGGTLTDSKGNSPPVVPITVTFGSTVTFTASSSDGSNGEFNGSIGLQFPTNTLTIGYNGAPSSAINKKGCTVGGSGGTTSGSNPNYQVNVNNQNCTEVGGCVITFSAASTG